MFSGRRSPLRRIAAVLPLAFVLLSCSRDPRRFVEGGNRYFQKGQYSQARLMYLSALKRDPKYADAYYRLALAEIRLAALDKTVIYLRRAVELLPEGSEKDDARIMLADIYLGYLEHNAFQKQAATETDDLAGAILKRNPDSYDGHRIKGTIALIRLRDLAGRLPVEARNEAVFAAAELQTANRIRPYQSEVVVPLAGSLEALGRAGEAEDLLRQTIDHNQASLEPYRALRAFYVRARRFDDARKVLDLAVQRNPNEYALLVDLAAYYWASGKPKEAAGIIEGMTARVKEFPNAFEVAGDFYLARGQGRDAVRQYEKGAAAFPSDKLKYQSRMAAILLQGRQWDEARRVNDAILKEHPKDVDALARNAALLFETGDIKGSMTQLEAVLRLSPNSPEAHYNLGRALMASKQPERARFQFTETIRAAPGHVAARLELAQIELDSAEYGKAVAAADAALGYQPRSRMARLIRAVGLRGMKKYPEARAELDSLLAENPDNPDVLYHLAMLDGLLGKWKEAEDGYRKSYEANPANVRGLVALATSMMARNQTDQALKVLRTEVNKAPERNDLRFMAATFATRAGRLDQAIPELEGLLVKLPPGSPPVSEVQTLLAECYLRSKDFQKALEHIEVARKLQPDNPMVLHYAGLTYDNLGRRAEAQKFYEASLKQNADDGVILNNLAYLIVENGGDPDLALTYAQRARLKMPHEPGFADTVGLIYLKKNLTDHAIEIFEDLVRQKPEEAVFHRHLGEALLKKGETARARKELRTALASKPSAEEAAKTKALLAKAGT